MTRRCPTPHGEQRCRNTGQGVRGQPYGQAVLRAYALSPREESSVMSRAGPEHMFSLGVVYSVVCSAAHII